MPSVCAVSSDEKPIYFVCVVSYHVCRSVINVLQLKTYFKTSGSQPAIQSYYVRFIYYTVAGSQQN